MKYGRLENACELFEKMAKHYGVSWNLMIVRYVKHGMAEEALKLHQQMQHLVVRQDKYLASVLSAYAFLPNIQHGRHMHDFNIKGGFESVAFVESSLVDMYEKCGCVEDSLCIFEKMHERVVLWTSMIDGYPYYGNMEDACHVFDEMPKQNVFSWNAMVGRYAQNGLGEEALKLWCQMKRIDIDIDNVTFVAIMGACARLETLEQGM